MPVFEYQCKKCQLKFEWIQSPGEASEGIPCPQCQTTEVAKLISRFAVGGQGDLRESTLHGCHGHDHGHGLHDHD